MELSETDSVHCHIFIIHSAKGYFSDNDICINHNHFSLLQIHSKLFLSNVMVNIFFAAKKENIVKGYETYKGVGL